MSHTFHIGLKLLRSSESRTRPEAWLLPSLSNPASIPKALLSIPDPDGWEVFWMPADEPSSPGLSLFVIPPLHRAPQPISNAFPYHRPYPDRNLFLPCGAALDAALEPRELDRLFPWPVVMFHPRHGAVAFEERQRMAVVDLFALPEASDGGFHHAHPGLPAPPHFVSAQPSFTALTSLKRALSVREGRSGTHPLGNSPPMPGQKAGPWSQRLQHALGEALARPWNNGEDLSSIPNSAQGWLRRLRLWAGGHLLDLQRAKEREFERLLHHLRHDPDAALHCMPPLRPNPARHATRNTRHPAKTGDPVPPSRPESSLSPEPPSVSTWVLDWRKHAELISAYRQTANRELSRGRPAHAAYIYAELLHDYQAAAVVLRQAKHYREAAVLYQKHLGQPREAAECLFQGGLLLEAAGLFERQHAYLAAANAWSQLGDRRRTRLAFHRAVDRCIVEQDFIAAAHILETHLELRSDAITLLSQRWPGCGDAESCLREELRLRARSRDWNLLGRRLEELSESPPAQSAPVLVRLLAQFAESCPDGGAREHSLDCAWKLTARSFRRFQPGLREQLLRSLSELAPEDRLLQRDAARYLDRLTDPQNNRKVQRSSQLPLLDCLDLPSRICWTRFLPRGRSGICGLGSGPEGSLALLRSTWTGSPQSIVTPAPLQNHPSPRFSYAWDRNPETLSVPAAGSLWSAALPATPDIPRILRGENPGWIERQGFLGMTFTPQGVAWVLFRNDDELVLYSFSPLGDLIASHSVGLLEPHQPEPAPGDYVPMAYARGQLFFALGDRLARYYRDQISFESVSGAIRDLTVSQPGAPVRVAAVLEQGVALFGFREQWGPPHSLPLTEPGLQAGFTLSGSVIAALPGHLELFQIDGETIRSVASTGAPDDPPLAVVATDEDSVFAVATANQIRRHRL
ncbi:MAG TPA: hypothetical protein VMN36_04105 [Verrucomicrobiales bacterium]|nr:hypothetical protein [Verrucomicrobiales bacterium]